jgi:signal transduction histidine kinase
MLINLVHDLSQPLTTIQLSAQLLRTKMAGTGAQVDEYIEIVQRQAALAERILSEFTSAVLSRRDQQAQAESLSFTNAETAAVT